MSTFSRFPAPLASLALLASSVLVGASALVGCTSSGVTPDCTVGGGGSDGAGGGSCNPKAICLDDQGKPADPAVCCADLSGAALETCKAGFDSGD